MLDIDALRLTDEEWWVVFKHEGIAPDRTTDDAIADAYEYLRDQILVAGVSSPKDGEE